MKWGIGAWEAGCPSHVTTNLMLAFHKGGSPAPTSPQTVALDQQRDHPDLVRRRPQIYGTNCGHGPDSGFHRTLSMSLMLNQNLKDVHHIILSIFVHV